MTPLLKKISPLLFIIILFACDEDAVIRGSGPVVSRTLTLPAIQGLRVLGSQDVVVAQGVTQEVTVDGQANLIDILSTQVEDGVWTVRFTENNVRTSENFTVYVTVPDLTQISVTGSGEVSSEQDLELDDINITVSGSGGVNLAGTVDTQTIQVSGSGEVSNYSLTSRETTAGVSGSGEVRVTATEVLNATVSGSGDIRYRGNPATVNRSVSGSGSISEG